VLQARDQLSQVLELQRERDVSEARRSERQQLLHDLHDGLGGTLVGNITALEAGGAAPSAEQILTVLRDARDDLRLVIDTNFNAPERSVVDAMATLRHRLTGRLERQGVRAIWDVSGLRLFEVGAAQVLELTRILQELVTNAVRHGQASEVRVAIVDCDGVLDVEVADNGRGFDPAASSAGIGLKGLHMRAARLGGHAEVRSDPRGTTVRVRTAISRRTHDPQASAGSLPSA
jgi:signal transduction histidine kinase